MKTESTQGKRLSIAVLSMAILMGFASNDSQLSAAEATIDYNADVRPIFNRYCTRCHGGVKQAGDVSLIYQKGVVESGIIEPGDADNSELLRRVLSEDPDERMPPPEDHPDPLGEKEISILRRWIDQGAPWGDHWSLEPPTAQPLPTAKPETWARQPLDSWVLARLNREGITPAKEAPPREWLRRVYFDLIGMPPTAEQYERFVKECAERPKDRESIYEAVVTELLSSSHFGERWAAVWMDLARYADSKGFEKDPHRDMWPYRDWLINAFNSDMPYDEFTIKQLAGDLLPDADANSLIATAFHRNTQTNTEGGTDDEEFRIAAVIDRVNTTWTVWQATTFGCVQCHSHPYDPFRHEEYYSFMAFFNSTADHDFDSDYPTIVVPNETEAIARSASLFQDIQQLRSELNRQGISVANSTDDWTPLKSTQVTTLHGSLRETNNHEFRTGIGTYPLGTVFKIESEAHPLTALRVEIIPENDDPKTWPETGAVISHLTVAWLLSSGEKLPIELREVVADSLTGPYDPRDSLRDSSEGFGGYPKLEGPRWAVFVPRERAVPPADAKLIVEIKQSASTTGARPVHLRRFKIDHSNSDAWIEVLSDETRLAVDARLKELQQERKQLRGPSLPVMVARDESASRPTRLFVRGNWLEHGELVKPATPGVLPPMSESNPTRLHMARWIASPNNPLTARVWVNRIWAQLFGIGIVETLEDFGSTGTPPSHPDLLDHLAVRIQQAHGYRLKPTLREIVLSATYRQSNRSRKQIQDRDPRNRLLARGPRTRLSAEMIRDQALLASGLLTTKIGGPSVMPPQPSGIWKTVYNSNKWTTAEGPNRYRRAIYTYWRRTSPYPSSLMFDAPSREFCSARRVSTNTPLQALVTLNDPVFVECAKALADRAAIQAGDDITKALDWMYRATCQQSPSPKVLEQLKDLHAIAVVEYGERGTKDQQALGESANAYAMTIVANTLLNIDRSVTK